MPLGLKRYQNEGDDHFVTFSCYNREPYLNTPASRDIFLDSLELTRKRYNLEVLGYVVMPEHVHLLLSEPLGAPLSKALQSLKLSVSKRLTQRPFWHTRYYDFNVFTHNKRVEKLKYMHRNPVTRGLVSNPEDWLWSTYRHYLLNEPKKSASLSPDAKTANRDQTRVPHLRDGLIVAKVGNFRGSKNSDTFSD